MSDSATNAAALLNEVERLKAELAAEREEHTRTARALSAAQSRLAQLEPRATPAPAPPPEPELPPDLARLQRQNTQLLALVQTLRLGLVLLSPGGQIQFISQHFWELFGIDPILPKEGEDSILPEDFRIAHLFHDADAFRKRAWEMHRAGQTVLQEEFVLANGRVLEMDYLVFDTQQAGRLICYRDVTERYQRTAQLRTLAYYMPQHTPSPIMRVSANGVVVYANAAAEPLLDELGGQGVFPMMVEAARRSASQTYQQELTAGGQFFLASAVAVPGQPFATLYLTNITARRLAEQQLAEQRDFYETVLSVLPIEMAVFDGQQRCLFVNPAVVPDPAIRQQAIGLTMEEYFVLRGYSQPSSLNEQRRKYFDLALRTHRAVSYEELQTGSKGREKLIMRHVWPVYHDDGTLRMIVGIGIDITARLVAERMQERVQQQLQEREDFVRQIVDAVPNALYLVEPDGDISFSNHAFRVMVPHSKHLFPAERTAQVQSEMRRMWEMNAQVLESGEAVQREMPFTMGSGEVFYYDVHKLPLKRPDGKLGVLTVSTNVTGMKQAREALERREKQYHDLVYYSQALICTHDLEGRLLTVNPAVERLLGLAAEQMIGRRLQDALVPERRPSFRRYLERTAAQSGQPRITAVQTATGEVRYLQYYSYRVEEPGQAPYVVASGHDITEGYLAQQALVLAKQEAEANAQAKEDFLARMSHEIRTPLNGVLGMAALLQKTALAPEQREYLNTMQLAGRHLLGLVNDVLDMAKITTQPPALEQLPFDLGVVVQSAGQTVAALAEEKGLELVVTPLPPDLVRVLGDAYRLRQVLLNLLSNAIKFTEQGRVVLATELRADSAAGVVVRFEVTDTGIGMTPAEQAHIFDAFTQANADTSRRYGGTGLGLAISHQLVRQMGGELALRSAPAEGATFSFELTLPRADNVLTPSPPATTESCYDGLHGRRVLVAEDNLVNQWIAVVVLEHWGMQVTAVSNGEEALAQLRENDYDAAVLDIRMPGLSGVEVTTAVRRQAPGARARVPIVAVTANAFESEQATYLAAGMDACITKPYEEEDLCRALLRLVGRATGPADPAAGA